MSRTFTVLLKKKSKVLVFKPQKLLKYNGFYVICAYIYVKKNAKSAFQQQKYGIQLYKPIYSFLNHSLSL